MIDDSIEELEVGFQHLLDGLRGVVKVLRDENAVLTAKVDEYRRLHGIVASVVTPQVDRVVVESPIVPVIAAVPIVKPKKPAKLILKACERCAVEVEMSATRRFCRPCFGIQAADRMRAARDKKLTEHVDERLKATA